jgi:membrane carboxypeptidase/penicillin-binding protein
MPSVPILIRLRQQKREQIKSSSTSRLGRIALLFSLLVSVLVAVTAIGSALAYADLTRDLPPVESLPALLEPPNGSLLGATRLYDRTGEHLIQVLQNPASSVRTYLPYKEDPDGKHLPQTLVKATVASADPGFWGHAGFQLSDLPEALRLSPGQEQTPTIAGRLANDLLLWDEGPGVRRVLRARLLAAQITSRYGREKILEWYLNSADYGGLNYGAEAASQAYFGISADRLNLAQAAVLAAVAEAPSLNPHDSPQAVLERYPEVLGAMRDQGMIDEDQYQRALEVKIIFRPPVEVSTELAPAFTNLVLEQLGARYTQQRILRGGLDILTSLDYDLQLQAKCAAENQAARIQNPQAIEIPALDGSSCQAARLLPTIPGSGSRRVPKPAANLVLLDPKSGQVLAMVGEPQAGLDPAHLPGYAPGSSLTPFIYLTGFSRGLTPASLLWDIPPDPLSEVGELTNPDGRFHGPVRLRIALANDYLVPASQVMAQMGVENVWRTANQLGIRSLGSPASEQTSRILLEGGEVTLLEVTQAYAVLAAQGVMIGGFDASGAANPGEALQPVTVLQVHDHEGRAWLDCLGSPSECDLQNRPVISAQLAYLMTHILSDETARWPSMGHPNSLEIGRPAAAKIGQTQDQRDAWTIGYTPSLVTGVWMGSDPQNETQTLPVTGAAGLWHAIMQYANRFAPTHDWTIPPGISSLNVCDPSGLLPTPECPVVVSEVFQDGNEPTHQDNLYQSFQINRDSGNLATIFTPPALIEERVYMVVPPEAETWARQAGLPTIPVAYDPIDLPETIPQDAQIRTPLMFSSIRGRMEIQGTASGARFDYYRLQIGQGLNPENWIQIGEDEHEPVEDGTLGTWDTTGLSGLYALQLLVVRSDQQVDTHTVQVRVDNQVPEVSIRFPESGQKFNYPQEKVITFQIDASDNLELAAVEISVDGELVNSLSTPPFAVPWDVKVGEHRLVVKASDAAGNQASAEVSFTVER